MSDDIRVGLIGCGRHGLGVLAPALESTEHASLVACADEDELAPTSDAAAAFKSAIDIDSQRLPSKCEAFNIFADIPHQRFSNEKAKRVLGWQPEHQLEQFWRKSPSD